MSILKTRVVDFGFVEVGGEKFSLGSLESWSSWFIITIFVPVDLDPIELRMVLRSALRSFERFDEDAMMMA